MKHFKILLFLVLGWFSLTAQTAQDSVVVIGPDGLPLLTVINDTTAMFAIHNGVWTKIRGEKFKDYTTPKHMPRNTPFDGQGLEYSALGDSLKWQSFAEYQVFIDSIAALRGDIGTGGGGSSTFSGLTDVSLSAVATGDVVWYNGSNWVNLGLGTADQVLKVNPGGTAPIWGNDIGSGGGSESTTASNGLILSTFDIQLGDVTAGTSQAGAFTRNSNLNTHGFNLNIQGTNKSALFDDNSTSAWLSLVQNVSGASALNVQHTNGSIGQNIASFLDANGDNIFRVTDYGIHTSNSSGSGFTNPAATETFGFGAGNTPTATGAFGAFFGYLAGDKMTSGSNVSFFGSNAGKETTSGSNLTAVGANALFENTTGSGLVAIGTNTLKTAQNSSDAIVIGPFATEFTTSLSNSAIFGPFAGRNYLNLDGIFLVHNSEESTSTPGGDNNAPFLYGSMNTRYLTASTDMLVRSGAGTMREPVASAVFELEDLTDQKATLLTRHSTTGRNAIPTPATGLQTYDTDQNVNMFYTGNDWSSFVGNGSVRDFVGGTTTIQDYDYTIRMTNATSTAELPLNPSHGDIYVIKAETAPTNIQVIPNSGSSHTIDGQNSYSFELNDEVLTVQYESVSGTWMNISSSSTSNAPTPQTFDNVTTDNITVTKTILTDSHLQIYINGSLMTLGVGNDYTRSGQVVTFEGGALSGDRVTAIVY